MFKKIKQWWARRKNITGVEPETYTREQLLRLTSVRVEKAYILGYNDGKRDGLTIARQQATKSLKEILWQQNNQTPKK